MFHDAAGAGADGACGTVEVTPPCCSSSRNAVSRVALRGAPSKPPCTTRAHTISGSLFFVVRRGGKASAADASTAENLRNWRRQQVAAELVPAGTQQQLQCQNSIQECTLLISRFYSPAHAVIGRVRYGWCCRETHRRMQQQLAVSSPLLLRKTVALCLGCSGPTSKLRCMSSAECARQRARQTRHTCHYQQATVNF